MSDPLTLDDAGLLTSKEAARRLKICTHTLRRMVKRGELPEPVRRSGRIPLYREEDITAHIKSLREQKSESA